MQPPCQSSLATAQPPPCHRSLATARPPPSHCPATANCNRPATALEPPCHLPATATWPPLSHHPATGGNRDGAAATVPSLATVGNRWQPHFPIATAGNRLWPDGYRAVAGRFTISATARQPPGHRPATGRLPAHLFVGTCCLVKAPHLSNSYCCAEQVF